MFSVREQNFICNMQNYQNNVSMFPVSKTKCMNCRASQV